MKDLTVGKERKLIFNFALPMLFGNLFQQLYNIVDSIIVGRFLHKQALAAVGASFPIIFTLISLVIGIGMGATIIISQYFGAKEYQNVKRTIDTMFVFLFFAAIILSAISIPLTDEIFILLKLPEDILPQATEYLNIYLTGLIFFFGFNAISGVLRGIGDSKTPLMFLIISTLFNIALDILFIVVFKWGISGAAWATIISQGGAFISAIIYLNRTHKLIQLSIKNLVFDRAIFKECIRIGLPSGLQHTFVSLGFMALLGIVNTFGTDVVAGYTAAMRIDSLAVLPAMNFASALSTFVGQNLGAKKIERVKTGFKATFMMSSTVSLSVTIIVVLFGNSLMSLFTTDANVIAIGNEYLIIISSFYLILSTMFLTNGVLRGAGDTIIPMLITLVSLWVFRIPIAWYLSGRIGETGIWWAVPIAWFVGLAISLYYYSTGRWKNKGVRSLQSEDMLIPETE